MVFSLMGLISCSFFLLCVEINSAPWLFFFFLNGFIFHMIWSSNLETFFDPMVITYNYWKDVVDCMEFVVRFLAEACSRKKWKCMSLLLLLSKYFWFIILFRWILNSLALHFLVLCQGKKCIISCTPLLFICTWFYRLPVRSRDGTSIILSDDVGQLYILSTGQGESQKDAKYDQVLETRH